MSIGSEINAAIENSHLSSFIGKTVTCTELRKELNKVVNKFGARVIIKKDKNLLGKTYLNNVSGEYVWWNKKSIHVFLHISPKRKKIPLTRKRFNRIIFLVSQTVQHENIHHGQHIGKRGHLIRDVDKKMYVQYQNKLRSTERKENILYYSSGEEISPHAHDLAVEMKTYYPNIPIKELLTNSGKYRKLSVITAYKQAFRGLKWDKLRKVLYKKTYQWYPGVAAVTQF